MAASSSMKSSYSPFHIVFIILVSYCIFVNFNIISDIAIEFRKSKYSRRIRKLLTSKVCFFLDFFFMLNSPTSRTPSAPAPLAARAASGTSGPNGSSYLIGPDGPSDLRVPSRLRISTAPRAQEKTSSWGWPQRPQPGHLLHKKKVEVFLGFQAYHRKF